MEVKNNPAGRLYDILEAARRQNPKEPTRKAWAAVFHVESDDTGSLLQMLADLIGLVSETKSSIQRLDGVDHELHLKPFKKIEKLLSSINLEASWENWRNQIDETMLLGLQFSADQLSRISGFTEIPSEELDAIRAAVDELFNTVVDSDLPADLKSLLIRNLESIRLALVAYLVRGIDGIRDEIERSFGSILLYRQEIRQAKPEEREVCSKFFKLVARLSQLVSLAYTSKELAAPAIKALEQMIR